MSLTVTLKGRLGNNFFQYALGRILAEKMGLALAVEKFAHETWHWSRTGLLTDLSGYFPNAPLSLAGTHHDGPPRRVQAQGKHFNSIDLEAILLDETKRPIKLFGFFQRAEYYLPHREKIREWFELKTGYELPFKPDPGDVLVNIRRGGDFEKLGWVLPLSYYHKILRSMTNRGRVYVCGVGGEETLRALKEFSPVYLTGGHPCDNLVAFQRFNRIILSNSTYAWWGGFLSEAEELYAPVVPDGSEIFAFGGSREVDLNMRSPRYHEVMAL